MDPAPLSSEPWKALPRPRRIAQKGGPLVLLKHNSCYSLRQRSSLCSQRTGAWPALRNAPKGCLALCLSTAHTPGSGRLGFSLSSPLTGCVTLRKCLTPLGIHVPSSGVRIPRWPASQDCCKDPKRRNQIEYSAWHIMSLQ